MSVREVGGIFHLGDGAGDDQSTREIIPETGVLREGDLLCLSGRTALQIALSEIRSRALAGVRHRLVAYLPSYCCEAMISPFVRAGFKLLFYPVRITADDRLVCDIKLDQQCDVFLATSYFGYSSTTMDEAIAAFKARGVTTIEDVTHKLLNHVGSHPEADYTFGSLRKWVAAPTGGFVRARAHGFSTELRVAGEAAEVGAAAMRLKTRYLEGEEPESLKEDFLRLQKIQSSLISDDYVDRGIDTVSRRVIQDSDFAAVRRQRLVNAKMLTSGIRDRVPAIALPLDVRDADCPLFVPILVDRVERPRLLHELRLRHLYMPAHWPRPSHVSADPATTEVYEREISLVCDQRYGADEMEAILDCLEEVAR